MSRDRDRRAQLALLGVRTTADGEHKKLLDYYFSRLKNKQPILPTRDRHKEKRMAQRAARMTMNRRLPPLAAAVYPAV